MFRRIGIVLVILLSGGSVSRAQQVGAESGSPSVAAAAQADSQASEPAPQSAGESTADFRESVGMLVVRSGIFGVIFSVVLGIFSLVAVMVAVERLVNLRRTKVVPSRFLSQLAELCRRPQCRLDDLRQLAQSERSPVGRILKAGLTRAGRPLPEVEKAMEDAAAREMAALRARHRPLSVIGSVAPLVGLLGTVVGMIFAFETTSRLGLGRGDQLAGAIYLALFTTAAGLTIAVPCLLLVAWFNTRIERFMRDMDESLLDTMPVFARLEEQSFLKHRQTAGLQADEVLVSQE
jgi:biopolymer transport protein ExbB